MTFTEAAAEVLRLVGKPLHYKKITQIAIERNLLSHVGKTPETTMSSRLATMVRKDDGEAPIIKVKPGIFGLREFDAKVLEAAKSQSGHEYELPPEKETKGKDDGADERSAPTPSPSHPGADVFPEEEGDDEPILAKIKREAKKKDDQRSKKSDDGGGKRRKRRRRRRGRKGDDDGGSSRKDNGSRRDKGSSGRSSRGGSRKSGPVDGDWERTPGSEDLLGQELADALATVLEGRRNRKAIALTKAAEELVKRGRLQGDAKALAPTLAAAVRGDTARRRRDGQAPRFRLAASSVELLAWHASKQAADAERKAIEAAEQQRKQIRRALIDRIGQMPAAGLLELVAAWLNAEGVTELRGVRRPGTPAGDFHLAGTWRSGPRSIPIAILVRRTGDLGREHVIDLRGGLHHYGGAQAAWLITLGKLLRGAKEELDVEGAVPAALFDADGLGEALERCGIGIVTHSLPLAALDLDLLEGLHGPGHTEDDSDSDEDDSKGGRRRRRKGRGSKGEDTEDGSDDDSDEEEDDDSDEEDDDEKGGRRKKRRRRSRSKSKNDDSNGDADDDDADDDDSDDDDSDDDGGSKRKRSKAKSKDDDSDDDDGSKGRKRSRTKSKDDSDEDDSDDDGGSKRERSKAKSKDDDSDDDDSD